MGICSMIMGILFILATPFTFRLTAYAGVGANSGDSAAILFIIVILGLQILSLFLGINGKKEGKTCSVAGIVLSAIPLVIHSLSFLLGLF